MYEFIGVKAMQKVLKRLRLFIKGKIIYLPIHVFFHWE